MKYLICSLTTFLLLTTHNISAKTYEDHLEHKRQLLIESSLIQIENIIEKNAENIPFLDYQNLIYHIYTIENLI
jgi:hypothetical protein